MLQCPAQAGEPPEPFGKGKRRVLQEPEHHLPHRPEYREEGIGLLGFVRAVGEFGQGKRSRGGEDQPGCFLTAEPQTGFQHIGIPVVEAGVFPADLRHGLFPHPEIGGTEVFFIEEPAASLTVGQKTAVSARRSDAAAQPVAGFAGEAVIEGGGIGIDADLPADTAVIPAAVRQTGERSIIGRGKMFHSAESPLLVKYPLLFYHGNEAAGRGFSREISVRGILAPEGIYRVY